MTEIKRKSTKKTEVIAETKPKIAEIKIISISFDRNSNLYGVDNCGKLYQYDFSTKIWGSL